MSAKKVELYEFANFRLDVSQKVLLRNKRPVPLTPKAFDTLEILLENKGRLLEKDELMQEIWKDHFVEESNLTSNIKTLRKALGDDAAHPRFIETVPRRGYRFIADVREVVNGTRVTQASATDIEKEALNSQKFKKVLLPVAALLVMGTIAGGLWYARNRILDDDAPILLADFNSEKLTADGNVRSAVVSPEGRYVVYTNATKGKESLWLRDLESSNNIQIIPPSENLYFGLAISPDGRTLYFARIQQNAPGGHPADVYRVSIFGGVPAKIISQTQGSVGLSPDGSRISFTRCPYREDEYCSLWIADSDGSNERQLLSRPGQIRIGDSRISPDGKTIAFGAGQSRNWANEFGLFEVDIESATEREITREKFFHISHLAWLPGGRGLLLTAKRYPDNNFRIWQVSPAGDAVALTNDSENYGALSLNTAATALVSTEYWADYRLTIYRSENAPDRPRVLTEASSVGFAPDGKIIFSSAMTGNHEIGTIGADGSGQRQLTFHPAVDLNGVTSPDNRYIFFDSNRAGEAQVWRMNADGTDQRQLTYKYGGFPIQVSQDGRWLYYASARDRKLMRISIDGGEEELVWDKSYTNLFSLSPDTSRVAFSEVRDKRTVIRTVSLADKQTIKVFDVPNETTGIVQSAWSADGSSLYYVALDDRSQNYIIWQQPLDGKPRVQMLDIGPDQLRETRAFAIAPDGKSFAVIQGSWKHDAVLIRGLK